MTDETRPEDQGTAGVPDVPGTTTAIAAAGLDQPAGPVKLHQQVEIRDVGPCRKHVKVIVDRKDIDGRLKEQFSKLVTESNVAGFRPGKAPRRLVERHFQKEVTEQVRNEVLYASLEQLGEDQKIAPLSPPDIDPNKITLPKEGPMIYEFEVEVAPEFELPDYKGIRLQRPIRTFTEDDIDEAEHRLLAEHGQIVPKNEGNAQIGDLIVAEATIRHGDRVVGTLPEQSFRVGKQLAFNDGIALRFGEQVKGASAGDKRVVDIRMATSVADPSLPAATVQATFDIKDVKTVRLPELTHEFLHTFHVHTPGQLRERIRVMLERRLEYDQRQMARQQVMSHIAASANWELPEDLLRRQAKMLMARRVMEMKADGISEAEIAKRERLLNQDVLASAALALKEHFVLQKIAQVEKLDVDEDDIDAEIERLAAQSEESPRRLRARLEKEEMLEALANEMIERRALDLILANAVYDDIPLDQENQPSALITIESQVVSGAMRDPGAAPAPNPAPGAAP